MAKVYERDREEIVPCRGCGVPIWFAKTPSGRVMPVTASTGETHFSTCEKADDFRAKHSTKDCCAKKARAIIEQAISVAQNREMTRQLIVEHLESELKKVGG